MADALIRRSRPPSTAARTAAVSSPSAGTAGAEDALLRRVLRGTWPALPALGVGSAAVCVAAAVTILLAPGISPVSTLLTAVLVGPFVAALAALAARIAGGDPAGIREWAADLRRLAGFGVAACAAPAVAGALFQVALLAWQRTGSALMLPSVAVTGAVTVLALAGLLAVLHLRAGDARLRGIALWRTGMALVALRPVGFVATGCLVGLGLWAAVGVSAAVLLIVPAPAALVNAAAVGTAVEAHRPR